MPILAYAALLAGVLIVQRRLIFRPDRGDALRLLAVTAPGRAWTVPAADGLPLRCWHLPADAAEAPAVLYLQGNGGHLAYRAARVTAFASLGWEVLLAGYRGYGGTGGRPSEAALLADARTCLAALAKTAPGRRRLVWGESLGSSLAARLAAEGLVDGVVLEAPFTSLTALIAGHFRWLRPALPLLRDRFDTARAVAAIRCPLFILAGARDTVAPVAMARALHACATAPRELLVLDAGHAELATPAAFAAIARFLATHDVSRPAATAS